MADVYTLRVRRTMGRREFPFDRVYLVGYDDRHVIKQLWRYALVFPVVGSLAFMLKKAAPETTLFRPHDRDDMASIPRDIKDNEWREFVENGQWVMVVPILPRVYKQEIEAQPRYLLAQDWAKKRDSKKRKGSGDEKFSLPSLSYLLTPERQIRPICAACPRFVFHQAGDCDIGQTVCFETLPMGGTDYFQEGLDAPEGMGPSDLVTENDDQLRT